MWSDESKFWNIFAAKDTNFNFSLKHSSSLIYLGNKLHNMQKYICQFLSLSFVLESVLIKSGKTVSLLNVPTAIQETESI